MVTRRDLRAERDFYSPMTGDRSSTYGSQVRSRLEDIKNVKGTRAPAIEAAFVKLLKTEDPFTQIDEKKSYAPDEEDGLMGALEGLGDGGGSDVVERVEEFLEPITGGGGGNKPNVISRNPNDRISRMSTSQLVDRDNKRYGNTFPDGAIGINSKSTDDFSKDPRYQSSITTKPDGDPGTPPKTEETRTYYGQGGLPLGTTTIRQGGEVKDGKYVGPQEKGPAINASGFQQKNVRGSGNPNNTGKDESARPKQTVASLPSNYKATEQKAFAAAKAYKSMTSGANVGSGAQANKGTGKDGGFGTGTYGKGRPSDSKTTNKATPSQSTAVKKATTVKKSSPSPSSSGRKSNTGSKKSSRGGSKSGGSKSGGSKSGGSKSGGSKSGGSKSNSGSKSSSRGAKGSSSSRSKGGTGTGRKGQGSKRSARRCDIRCKVDISALTNLNLIKDDLADVAYFVKELQKK